MITIGSNIVSFVRSQKMQRSLLLIFEVGGQIMSFVVRRSMCAEQIVAPFSESCDIIDVSARLVSFDLGRQLCICTNLLV